jgi:hypothetical protein
MNSSDCFVLLGGGTRLGEFASFDDAKRHAEEYCHQMLMEEEALKPGDRVSGKVWSKADGMLVGLTGR